MDLLSRIASWLGENEVTISAVVGIAVLTGIVLAGLRSLVRRRGAAAQEKAASAATEPPSSPDLDPLTVPGFEGRPAIAVLPFDNLSGDPDQEYFADGIAEDLITRLSHLRWFPVIARNSSFTYKGRAVDVKQVGRELGARYVLEGSVRKAGDRVRISAQLIDATTGAHVWAETYDRELEDIFQLQDEITEAITGSSYPEVVRSEEHRAVRKEPQSLDAWDWFVQGRWHFAKSTKEDTQKALSFFKKATELDPAFALAFGFMALAHVVEAAFEWTDSGERSIQEANRLARKTLELDRKESLGHVALAHSLASTGQRQQAIAALERAVEVDPNQAYPHGHLGFFLSYTGRPDEAIAHLKRAMSLSPKDATMFLWLTGMGLAHFAKGKYEQAASWLERCRQSQSNFNVTYRALAATYAELGRMEEARMVLQEDLRLAPNDSISFIKEQISCADPDYLERYFPALRKAGMHE